MLGCALASQVSGQPPAKRAVTLRLDADAGCLSSARLRERIVASSWRWADGSQTGAQLALEASVLRQAQGELLVRLRVHWPNGRSAERSLAAQSCDASLDALALLVQMTLDATPAAVAAEEEPERWHSVTEVSTGVSVHVGSGAAPELQPGLGAFAALGLRGAGMLRPWLQLELAHAWSNAHSYAAGRADFSWDGGQVLLCPIAWRPALLAAHGCGAFELARLRARGYDTFEPRTHTRAWASVGAVLLVRVPVWKMELQLMGALVHPLSRDQFSFAPEVFFAVPAWRWQLKVGVGVRFL